ncbi:hypothetical protein GCM10028808_19380 [Spirosoma migulaei]
MRNVESVYYVDNKLDVGVFVMLMKEASQDFLDNVLGQVEMLPSSA